MNKRQKKVFTEETLNNGLNPYAHTRSVNGVLLPESTWEPLCVHLDEVAKMAKKFGARIGLGSICQYCGYCHDMGKNTYEFLQRLRGELLSFDHAAYGAYFLDVLTAGICTQIVLGHHGGIPDDKEISDRPNQGARDRVLFGSTCKVHPMLNVDTNLVMKACADAKSVISFALDQANFDPSMKNLMRPFFLFAAQHFMYSCLVDSDYLCTERFYTGKSRKTRLVKWSVMLERVRKYQRKLVSRIHPNTAQWVLEMRQALWEASDKAADLPYTVYSMTAPTGSGKTIAYLGFAIKKAMNANLKTIIVVLPYCAVTSQVSQEFRNAIGDSNVIEHHTGCDLDELIMQSTRYKRMIKKSGSAESVRNSMHHEKMRLFENWDGQVIVTTREQFDESFFCRNPGKSRKVHNMANAVIVFDEIQSTPLDKTIPFVAMLHALRHLYKSVIVQVTATMPSYDRSKDRPWGLEDVYEIMPHPDKYFLKAAERVRIIHKGDLTSDQVAEFVGTLIQVLVFTTTRYNAMLLSDKCRARKIPHIHISSLLTKKDIASRLKEAELALKEGRPIRLIVTSIVEAGWDPKPSFPNIIQPDTPESTRQQQNGRGNRHGELPQPCNVFRINLTDGNTNPSYAKGISMSETVRWKHGKKEEDVIDLATIKAYFDSMLKNPKELDDKHIVLTKPTEPSVFAVECPTDSTHKVWRTNVSRYAQFKYIDSRASIVIAMNDECRATIREAKQCYEDDKKISPKTMSVLRHNMVSIYDGELQGLIKYANLDESVGFWILNDIENWYDQRLGLMVWNLPKETGSSERDYD